MIDIFRKRSSELKKEKEVLIKDIVSFERKNWYLNEKRQGIFRNEKKILDRKRNNLYSYEYNLVKRNKKILSIVFLLISLLVFALFFSFGLFEKKAIVNLAPDISFIDNSQGITVGESSSTNILVPTHIENDFLIAVIGSAESGLQITEDIEAPLGWFKIDYLDTRGDDSEFPEIAVFGRIATDSEPASYIFKYIGSEVTTGLIHSMSSYRNVNIVNPIGVESHLTYENIGCPVASTVTTPVDGSMVIYIGFTDGDNVLPTPETDFYPASTNGRIALESPDGGLTDPGFTLGISDEFRAISGSTGNRDFQNCVTDQEWGSLTITLNPNIPTTSTPVILEKVTTYSPITGNSFSTPHTFDPDTEFVILADSSSSVGADRTLITQTIGGFGGSSSSTSSSDISAELVRFTKLPLGIGPHIIELEYSTVLGDSVIGVYEFSNVDLTNPNEKNFPGDGSLHTNSIYKISGNDLKTDIESTKDQIIVSVLTCEDDIGSCLPIFPITTGATEEYEIDTNPSGTDHLVAAGFTAPGRYPSEVSWNTGSLLEKAMVSLSVRPPTALMSYLPTTSAHKSSLSSGSKIQVDQSTNGESGDHYSFLDFDRSLVGWYRFDILSPVIDESLFENDAISKTSGVVINIRGGRYGKGSLFPSEGGNDGDENNILIPTNGWDLNAFTFSGWVKANGFRVNTPPGSNPEYIFGMSSSPTAYENQIQIYTDDITGSLDIGINGHTTALDVFDMDVGVWYHIALTIDGDNYKVFVDGLSVHSGNYISDNGGGVSFDTLATNAMIGNVGLTGSDGSGPFAREGWDGFIDEVLIFNRPLSAIEISSLYNSHAPSYFSSFVTDAKTHITVDDNDGGSIVFDQSPRGDDGTLTNGATIVTEGGSFGKVLEFDGSDDFVQLGTGFAITGDFTMGAWINSESTGPSFQGFLGSDLGADELRSPFITIFPPDRINYGYGEGTGMGLTSHTSPPDITIDQGKWNHVVIRLDEITNFFDLFIDGSLVVRNFGINPLSGTEVRDIGKVENFFKGKIDEVFVFDRTLTDAEIKNIFMNKAAQYSEDFVALPDNIYSFSGHAVDEIGSRSIIESRLVGVGTGVEFETPPTPEDFEVVPVGSNIETDLFSTGETAEHYSFVNLDNNLLLWAQMDSDDFPGGGVVVDKSGNGLDGMITGSVTNTLSGGKFGGSAEFASTDEYIEFPDGDLNDGFIDITISVWIKRDSSSSRNIVLTTKPDGVNNGFYISTEPVTNKYKFFYWGPGPNVIESNSALISDIWQHVVITKSSTQIKMYVDGVLQNDIISGINLDSISASTQKLRLGCRENLGNCEDEFGGELDDLMIFKRILDQNEVNSLFNSQVSQYAKTYSGLASGDHMITGYAVDQTGFTANTEIKTVIIDGVSVEFGPFSPLDLATISTGTDISIDLISGSNSPSHYSFVDLDNTLRFWLRMETEEVVVNDLTESSSNSLVGTFVSGITASPPPLVPGKFGDAVDFERDNNDVIIFFADGPLDKLNPRGFSASAWINIEAIPANGLMTIIERHSEDFVIEIDTTGSTDFLRCTISEQSAKRFFNYDITATPLSIGSWHHVACVWDPIAEQGRLYLDGVLVNQGTALGFNPFEDPDNSPFYIGRRQSLSNAFDGLIDEVQIYNRALTQNEIKSLVNSDTSQYNNIFVNQALGGHTFIGYAVDEFGNVANTEERSVTIGSLSVNFESPPTPLDFDFLPSGSDIPVDLLSAAVTSIHYSLVDFDSSLLLWTQMDSDDFPGGGVVVDKSGNGLDGMITGTVTNVISGGKFGDSASFGGGASDYVEFPSGVLNSQFEEFSLSVWIKPKVTSAGDLLLGTTPFALQEGSLLEINGGTNKFTFYMYTPATLQIESDSSFSSGAWQHVVITKSATDLKMYIDGVLQIDTISGSVSPILASTGQLRLGCVGANPACTNNFDGELDDIMIFNHALNDIEVESLFNSQFPPYFFGYTTNLKFHTSMNDFDSDNDVDDLSANVNDGILTGGASLEFEGGELGNTALFNAAGEFIDLASPVALDDLPLGSFSISTWIKPKTTGGFGKGRIAAKRQIGAGGWLFFTEDTSSLGAIVVDTVGFAEANSKAIDNSITLDEWNHVVMTYDNAFGRIIKLYVNSIEVTYDTQIAATAAVGTDNTGDLHIGDSPQSAGREFDGNIDEFLIFNSVLTSAEIETLYRNKAAQYFNDFTGLPDGLHDFTGYVVDEFGETETTELRTVNIGGPLPLIVDINSESLGTQFINVENLPTQAQVSFVVTVSGTNSDHASNVISASATSPNSLRPVVTNTGPACIINSGTSIPTLANYDCTVSIDYFNEPGLWTIEAILDNVDLAHSDSYSAADGDPLENFNLAATKFGKINTLTATFIGSLLAGDFNKITGALEIQNFGNEDIPSVKTTPQNLLGLSDPGFTIDVDATNDFRMSNNAGTVCTDTPTLMATEEDTISVTPLLFNPATNPATKEDLFICIKSVPSGLIEQTYSSTWEIVFTFLPFLTLAGTIKVQRKKKKKKLITEDILMNLIDSKLKDKYGINLESLLDNFQKNEFFIPLSIFSKFSNPAESLVTYLKNNKKLKFSQIAKELNRDIRSIWTSYQNAKKKKIKIVKKSKNNEILIPIVIFANRKFSILENLILFLKNKKNMSLREISRILNKNISNIYNLNARIKKKQN